MSRDLSFWKNTKKYECTHEEVYIRLSEGEFVEGLDTLPVEDIMSEFVKAFGNWNRLTPLCFEREDSSFEIMINEQFVRVDCYSMSEQDMNTIIDIMDKFKCPLYDSVIDVRFDGE